MFAPVSRLQGVNINDKHNRGDLAADDALGEGRGGGGQRVPDRRGGRPLRFMHENNRLTAEGKKAASGHPLLLEITKASLSTDSFRRRRAC